MVQTASGTRTRAQIVELSVPASAEYIQIVRLVLSGIGNAMKLNVEEIEDLKLAVGEACYNVFHSDAPDGDQIHIKASADGRKLVVDVYQKSDQLPLARLFAAGNSTEKGIGVILMKHLVDQCEYKTGPNGVQVRLIKYRKDPA